MARIQRKLDASVEGTFDLGTFNETHPHTQISIGFLTSAGVSVTPSAGVFTISVRLDGADAFELVQLGEDIDATEPVPQRSYAGIADEFKYDPTGVTGAALVRITLTATEA